MQQHAGTNKVFTLDEPKRGKKRRGFLVSRNFGGKTSILTVSRLSGTASGMSFISMDDAVHATGLVIQRSAQIAVQMV
jgi:hypothetical protein